MKTKSYVLVIAGMFVLASALLGFFYNKYWLVFTMFVGLNLFQYGFSGFCPLEIVLKKLNIGED